MGSICRAMKNMGIQRLALVNPSPSMDKKHLKTMAVHAGDIYRHAIKSDSLSQVLENTVLSAGITRRRGNRRKSFSYLPEEFCAKASEIAQGDIALVFGNEQHGLSEEELSCCSAAVHIPSNPEHPSLNLSHAVQIMTYSLYRQAVEKTGRFIPIVEEDLQKLTETIYQSLDGNGIIKQPDVFDHYKFFHDILGRATLSQREARHLEKIFQALKHKK